MVCECEEANWYQQQAAVAVIVNKKTSILLVNGGYDRIEEIKQIKVREEAGKSIGLYLLSNDDDSFNRQQRAQKEEGIVIPSAVYIVYLEI